MKHIFIASVGGAPQVVTETLWAMMHPHKLLSAADVPREPVVPGEVIMLTTAFKGLGNSFKSKDDRLKTTRAKILKLYQQYDHEVPEITSLVVKDAKGNEIEDIRNQAQNVAYADAITRVLTEIHERRKEEKITIHMSLAGGRKSMSSYDHSAMMFYGQPEDELTHVLTDPSGLEGCFDFWWPDQAQKKVIGWDNKNKVTIEFLTTAQMDADGNTGDAARLDLVRVPYVPLGISIPKITALHSSYEKLVNYLNWQRRREPIVFHRKSREISVSGERLKLTDSNFAYLSTLAKARKESWQSPYDNQHPELRGNVLLHDLRFGRDKGGHDRNTPTVRYLTGLYEGWKSDANWNQDDSFERNFFDDVMRNNAPDPAIPGNMGKQVSDSALGGLTRKLAALAKKHYLPGFLNNIKAKKVADSLPSAMIGLDVDAGRIDFKDD